MSQDRKMLVLFTAFYGLVVIIDYLTTVDDFVLNFIPALNGFFNSKGLARVFYDHGSELRGGFLLLFFIFAYNEIISLKLKAHDFDRMQYILLTGVSALICNLLFVFIKHLNLEQVILVVLYPLLLILSMFATYHFAKALSIRTKIAIDEFDLSGDDEAFGTFVFKTTEGKFINVLNPFQGIFVVGSAGAGKSKSVAHPMIFQLVQQGFTGIIYDYKFFDLTNVVYTAFQHYPEVQENVGLKIINFSDMYRSHRINPIHPDYIFDEAFIDEYVSCILKNLNKEWIKKSGDFFATSAILLLKAIVYFLWKKHPEFCTIPHAFSLVNLLTTEQIVDVLKGDRKALSIASSVQEAVEKDAMEQVAGVIATLKSQTQKLDNENFFWVLSGNDIDLNLNSPSNKQLLCLINDQQKEETITPVISLIVTVARKLMNTKHREKSIFLLDEAPTLFLPNFDTLPATGRSNKLCACVMCQDISQMDSMYEKVGREKILGSLGNTFYGNCSSLPTQEYISKSFGKVDKIIESQTQGRNKSTGSIGQNDSSSYNVQERELIKPSDVGAFEIGEFCGKIIGKENAYYRTRFDILDNEGIDAEEFFVEPFSSLVEDLENPAEHEKDPLKYRFSIIDVHKNYERIIEDIMSLKNMYCTTELEKAKALAASE